MSALLSTSLTVSVVVYRPDEVWLRRTLTSLQAALQRAFDGGQLGAARVVLIDNQATAQSPFGILLAECFKTASTSVQTEVIAGHGNVGYGAGNNLAIERHAADYHLVLNPDVELDASSISNGLAYLAAHAECVMVSPVATTPAGAPLYLVKSYPSVLTLLLRGFAPEFVRSLFSGYLARYERSAVSFDAPLTDARIVSGCFMLARGDALREARGFDPGYFLYFEDFDLGWRMSSNASIARVPACRIVHGGGGAAGKGLRHIAMFTRSALRFFNQHGWRII